MKFSLQRQSRVAEREISGYSGFSRCSGFIWAGNWVVANLVDGADGPGVGKRMTMDTLNANEVETHEIDALVEAAHDLETKSPNSPLAGALAKLAMDLSQGRDVVLMPADAEISPAAAAKILGMSRPHLCKLLDAGAIPFNRVGRDRRIKVQEVNDFMRKRELARCELAEKFARSGTDRTDLVARLAGVEPDTARRLGF